MKRYLYLFSLLFVITISRQQAKAQYYYDDERKPIQGFNPANADVDGSPFASSAWTIGSAVDVKGVVYKDLRVKYDMVNDRLIFAGANDELMAFDVRISQFTVNGALYMNGFPPVGKMGDTSYYQVLENGKNKLLLHSYKTLQSTKLYGSAVSTYRYDEKDLYYLYKDGKMMEIKTNRSSILAAMNDKAGQINNFLSATKINFKNSADLARLCNYYNSL